MLDGYQPLELLQQSDENTTKREAPKVTRSGFTRDWRGPASVRMVIRMRHHYRRVHTFPKNLDATSKFYTPEPWNTTNRLHRTKISRHGDRGLCTPGFIECVRPFDGTNARVNTWRRDVVKDRDATRREKWLQCNFTECLSNYTNCKLFWVEESRVIRLVSAQSQCSVTVCGENVMRNMQMFQLYVARPLRTRNEFDGRVWVTGSRVNL